MADFALFPHLSAVGFLGVPFSRAENPHLAAWHRRLWSNPVFASDLLRVHTWLEQAGEQPKLERIIWRGDRIGWLLANGGHRWFLKEIVSDRVAWPRRER